MAEAAQSAVDIQALYAKAAALKTAGKPDEALPLFGQVIEANPRVAEAHWQVAQIFGDVDEFERALMHASAAAKLRPAEPTVWATWADLVALAGDRDAERAFLTALRDAGIPAPVRLRLQDRFSLRRMSSRLELSGVSPKVFETITDLMNKAAFAKAQTLAASILRDHPKSALAMNAFGTVLAAQGKMAESLAQFQAATRADPFFAEAFLNIGRTLDRLGKGDEALKALRAAIARAPDNEAALHEYGQRLNQIRHPRRALHYLERLVRVHPNSLHGRIAISNSYTQLKRYEDAYIHSLRAVELSKEKSPEALGLLAQSLSHLQRDSEALEHIEAALALNPNYVPAIVSKATLLQHLGRFEEAEPFFKIAMECAPLDGSLFRNYMASHKATKDDPIVAQMMAAVGNPVIDDLSRSEFSFAIAKGLEDQKRYDIAFPYLKQANDLARQQMPYDINFRYEEVAALKQAMGGFDWAGTVVPGTSDGAPIFVTGMPRSGTTLIEQIIASHSTVAGGGELALLPKPCRGLVLGRDDDSIVPQPISGIAPERIARLGHTFIGQLAERFPEAERVTDKSITTYNYIGLVKLALPQARIIVVRRDPRDNLLSIYKNRFAEGSHGYSTDLRDLANYYATFVEMVEFWRAETPDWFTEVQYETLVANPEAESRRLVAACGLDWEDACLNFHENKRRVDTLSVYQVRQPISGGSVKAWQRYEAELAPMIEVLAERGLLPE